MAIRLRKMDYQEKVLSIVLKVKKAGVGLWILMDARFGRNKSESMVGLGLDMNFFSHKGNFLTLYCGHTKKCGCKITTISDSDRKWS